MNIIFISRRHKRPRSLALSGRLLLLAAVCAMVLPMVLGAAGYHLYSQWQGGVGEGRQAQAETRRQIEVIKGRLADVQAHMERLDALGEHLTQVARISSTEFDFSRSPTGGPLRFDDLDRQSLPELKQTLDTLGSELERREGQLFALESFLLWQQRESGDFLQGMPVRRGYISSQFGTRADPFTGKNAFHGGLDIVGNEGTPIYAVAPGLVTWAGPRTGYGNMVEVSHGNGLLTRYAHARSVAVHVGDTLSEGQLLAAMGSTGRSTGPHLHYEVVRDGHLINPISFVKPALAGR